MMSGHSFMWGNMYRSDKPMVRKRINWRRIGALFAPYWRQQAFVLACIVVASALGLLPGFITARIIDSALPHKDFRELIVDVVVIVASALVAGAIGVVQGYLNSVVGEGIMRDIRTRLVAHMHRMPLSFFTGTKTGEIMNRVSNDVDNVDNVVTGTLTTIVTNIAMILTTLIAMFIWDWRLAIISVLIVPIMIFPLGPVGRRMYNIRKKTREKRDEIESITQETLSISGITLIKSFARELYERSRFYDVGTRLMKLEIDLAMVGRWFLASVTAMVVVGPALVWLGGGWFAIVGTLQVGVIVAFVSFIQGRLYGPAATLAGIQVQIVSALAVFERIFDYLDLTTEEYNPPNAITLPEIRGDVRFEDVYFSYDATAKNSADALPYGDALTSHTNGAIAPLESPTGLAAAPLAQAREILQGISFHVEPGQIAAFVGLSGAGKTTITQLVPRFYDPQRGRVSIDGHDVRTVTLESLRRDIGIVTQETYLFHDTVANNLRYGNPDATDEELHEAARNASIHQFITSLPEGFNTMVGERGHKLSGGERQRLAIARVLLKDPRILILDEATSSLDSENEAAIQSALDVCMRGRTSLVIAHRLSTIRSADIIFVVESGRIVESGRHADLLARNGVYARLYTTQFRDTTLSHRAEEAGQLP